MTTAAEIRARQHLGLLGAVSLPQGGFLAVDLFQPSRPVHLLLTRTEAETESSAATISRALAADEPVTPDATVPPPWVRLAVVAGVTRWFDNPLDEDLLAADRALALAEAGDHVTAEAVFSREEVERALLHLADTVERLVTSQPGSARTLALRGETLRVPQAAATGSAFYAGAIQQIEDAQAAGMLGGRGGQLIHRGPAVDFDRLENEIGIRVQEVDRLHVPARMLPRFESEIRIDADAGSVSVSTPALKSIRPGTPAAARLLARTHVNGDITAIGAMELVSDQVGYPVFQATLPLRGADPESVEVDIYDSAGLSAPRAGVDGHAHRAGIAAAQDAFTAMRQAAADEVLGEYVFEQREAAVSMLLGLRRDQRIVAAAEVGAELVEIADLDAQLIRAPAPDLDASRPLLAELRASVSS